MAGQHLRGGPAMHRSCTNGSPICSTTSRRTKSSARSGSASTKSSRPISHAGRQAVTIALEGDTVCPADRRPRRAVGRPTPDASGGEAGAPGAPPAARQDRETAAPRGRVSRQTPKAPTVTPLSTRCASAPSGCVTRQRWPRPSARRGRSGCPRQRMICSGSSARTMTAPSPATCCSGWPPSRVDGARAI